MSTTVQTTNPYKLAAQAGIALRKAGRYEKAFEHYETVRRFFELGGNEFYRHWLCGVGMVHFVGEEYETAIDYFKRCLELKADSHSELLDVNAVRVNLACACSKLNRFDEAHEYLVEPEKYFKEHFAYHDYGEVIATKAEIYFEEGEFDLALSTIWKAIRLFRRIFNSEAAGRALELVKKCREAKYADH
jgi:tetratricopeptide (TPR) repeat protein